MGTVLDCCSVVPSVHHSSSAASSTQMLTFFESVPHAPTNLAQVCIYIHPSGCFPLILNAVFCHIRQPNMRGCHLAAGGSAARSSKKPSHSSRGNLALFLPFPSGCMTWPQAKDFGGRCSHAAAVAGHCNAICGGGPINVVNAIQQ